MAIALTGLLLPCALFAQEPTQTSTQASDLALAKVRAFILNKLMHHALKAEDSVFQEGVSAQALIAVDLPHSEPQRREEPLTAGNLRLWLGSCAQLPQIAVTIGPDPYRIHSIYQCSTGKLAGDVRAIFTFDKGLLTGVHIGKVNYMPAPPAGSVTMVQASSSDDVPLREFLDEHHARLATIEALLDAMARADQARFRAIGGDKIFFSSDPERIFSAVVAPSATHLAVDSLAGLRSCKHGTPIASDADWYAVSWQCSATGGMSTSQYSFKFSGRNLVAIQAARPAPKFKFN